MAGKLWFARVAGRTEVAERHQVESHVVAQGADRRDAAVESLFSPEADCCLMVGLSSIVNVLIILLKMVDVRL